MSKYTFLHILSYDKNYTGYFVDFINESQDEAQHTIVVLDLPKDEELNNVKNVIAIDTTKLVSHSYKIYKLFSSVDRIIWHGIYIKARYLVIMYFCRIFDKKFVWIIQGNDLYITNNTLEQGLLSKYSNKIKEYLNIDFRRRFSYVGYIFKRDRDYFLQNFNSHARAYEVSYIDKKWCKRLENTSEIGSDLKNISSKTIVVGMNVSPLNRHCVVLNSISRYRYKNIRIKLLMCGISEGEYEDYTKEVYEYARLMYGEKVELVTDSVLSCKYIEHIKSADIILSGINSNIGHCHFVYECILSALKLNRNVYLYEKSVLYNILKKAGMGVKPIPTFANLDINLDDSGGTENSVPAPMEVSGYNLWGRMYDSLKREYCNVDFLHIIRPSNELSMPIINLVSSNFSIDEHRFLIKRKTNINSCESFLKNPYVDLFLVGRCRIDRFIYFYKRLNKAKFIVWHGLYAGFGNPILSSKELLFLLLFPKFLKKMIWVGWGADLYDWKLSESVDSSIIRYKNKLYNFFNYYVREKIPYFVTIFLPDAQYYMSEFPNNRNIFDASYSNPKFIELLELSRPLLSKRENAPVRVMVGHSANKWNNHIKLLNSLAKYRYENIRIYLPLSTGIDMIYARKVKKYAKYLFGKKVVCIDKKMPLEKYLRFLWMMDIAIFDFKRQAALGNIMNLIYMDKKIFLPDDCIMYDFFKSKDIQVFNTVSIDSMTFSEFIRSNPSIGTPNYIYERTDYGLNIQKWKYVFDEVSKRR